MPWKASKGHGCPPSKPWAVVKPDGTGRRGCHESLAKAQKQIAALYASEKKGAAMSGDVVVDAKDKFAPDPEVTLSPDGGFHAVLVIEGERTSDGREFSVGSLTTRSLPIPLLWQKTKEEHHDGAVVVGKIEKVERRDAGEDKVEIHGWGHFDMGGTDGREAYRLVDEQVVRGVSIDAELMSISDEIVELDNGLTLLRVTQGRIMGATLVNYPAFPSAVIALENVIIPEATPDGRPAAVSIAASTLAASLDDALVAHAEKPGPSSEWFTDPLLKDPTPITVSRNGRVYGHAAIWGACHISREDVCLTPPRSVASYAYFMLGETRVSGCDCEVVATGPITVGTTHASLAADPEATRHHYDDTGRAVADVAVGEDVHGIWVAGALRPGCTEEQIRALRGSALSGDWRRIGGNLELVALLAVNTPGFPIPRVGTGRTFGRQTSLVASGIPDDEVEIPHESGQSPEELLAALKAEKLEGESKDGEGKDAGEGTDDAPSNEDTVDEAAPNTVTS